MSVVSDEFSAPSGGSLRSRLILAFSVMLALLLTVSTVALNRFETLTASMHEFVDHQARLAYLAQRANQHAQSASVHLLRLLQIPDRERRVPLYSAMDSALADSDAAIGDLEHARLSGDDDTDIRQLIDLRTRYGASIQATVELIEVEGLVAARRHFNEQTDGLLNNLLSATLAVAGHRQERMQADMEQLESAIVGARTTVWVIAVVASLVGAVLALLIAHGIVGPIQKAVAVAESIAGGNYDCPVPAGRGREIGTLMHSLDVMRESIASREQHILTLAYEDRLTGLPNRTRFMEVVTEALAQGSGVLILLNIDRFSHINNALGHQVGDRMLEQFAKRLGELVKEQHFISRLGGDEFAIVIRNADKAAAAQLAQAMLSRLREPMVLDGQRLDMDASLGIVRFPEDSDTLTTLLRRADLAMVLAKRRHDGYAFATDVTDEPQHEQLSLIGEMREALAREEFTVFFQPKLDLATHRIKGAEALLRWWHPERGLVPPGRFIPFAEQTGFIREITPWLLRSVIAHASAWHRDRLNLVVSANLSALDLLSTELVGYVQSLLNETGLPPSRLCLEITESALMDDPETALDHLRKLADFGVKLSIDDYGSGQASLAYVKNLPVHELKIDRALVDKVDRLPKNAAIVRSTILLCRELNLAVVAEGAETQDELDWLMINGCEIVQGYGVAKPMPAAEFPAWVANFERDTAPV